MNCAKARDILNAVFDGDRPALAADAERHLAECAQCREWDAALLDSAALGSSGAAYTRTSLLWFRASCRRRIPLR